MLNNHVLWCSGGVDLDNMSNDETAFINDFKLHVTGACDFLW